MLSRLGQVALQVITEFLGFASKIAIISGRVFVAIVVFSAQNTFRRSACQFFRTRAQSADCFLCRSVLSLYFPFLYSDNSTSSDHVYENSGLLCCYLFAHCTTNRTLSHSFKLLSGETLNFFNSSMVYLSFRFLIRSSTSSEVSIVILDGRGEVPIFNYLSCILPIRLQPVTFAASRSIRSHSAWIRVMSLFCRSFGSLDLLSGALCIIRFFFLLGLSSSSRFCSDLAKIISFQFFVQNWFNAPGCIFNFCQLRIGLRFYFCSVCKVKETVHQMFWQINSFFLVTFLYLLLTLVLWPRKVIAPYAVCFGHIFVCC